MTEEHVIGWVIFVTGLGLGYLIGHGRGYVAALRYCIEHYNAEEL